MWILGYPHGWELSVVHSMQAWGVKLPKKVLSCAFGRPKQMKHKHAHVL